MKITIVAIRMHKATFKRIKDGASVKIRYFKKVLIRKRQFWFQLVMLSLHCTYQMSEFYLNHLNVCEKNLIQTRNFARHQCLWIFFFCSQCCLYPSDIKTSLWGWIYFSISPVSLSPPIFYLLVPFIEVLRPFVLSSLLTSLSTWLFSDSTFYFLESSNIY